MVTAKARAPSERIASACFYLAALVALTGALGVLLGSVPEIQGRLGVDPVAYWNDRLQASLILAAFGLFFGVIVNLVGAYLASSREMRASVWPAASYSSSPSCPTSPASSVRSCLRPRTGRTPSRTSWQSCSSPLGWRLFVANPEELQARLLPCRDPTVSWCPE